MASARDFNLRDRYEFDTPGPFAHIRTSTYRERCAEGHLPHAHLDLLNVRLGTPLWST